MVDFRVATLKFRVIMVKIRIATQRFRVARMNFRIATIKNRVEIAKNRLKTVEYLHPIPDKTFFGLSCDRATAPNSGNAVMSAC
jgi:hypothetical protein